MSLQEEISAALKDGMRAKDEAKLTLAVIGLILTLGENPFAFLGLPFDASMDEVKRVRNAVMKAIHPDVLRTLLPDLPPWMVSEFDTLVLRTQEAYERIQRMRDRCKAWRLAKLIPCPGRQEYE